MSDKQKQKELEFQSTFSAYGLSEKGKLKPFYEHGYGGTNYKFQDYGTKQELLQAIKDSGDMEHVEFVIVETVTLREVYNECPKNK